MAQVVKNADLTFTVTFSLSEQNLLRRWAAERSISMEQQLEYTVNGFLVNKAADYRGQDGPKMQDKYNALHPDVQAQIDSLLK